VISLLEVAAWQHLLSGIPRCCLIFPFPIVVCRQNYAAIHKNGWQKNHWRYFNADMLF